MYERQEHVNIWGGARAEWILCSAVVSNFGYIANNQICTNQNSDLIDVTRTTSPAVAMRGTLKSHWLMHGER